MIERVQPARFSASRNRWQDKRQRLLSRLAAMRAAKARKRKERIDAGWRPEPKMERAYPLSLGVRDEFTGETAWVPFRSVRDAAERLSVVQRFYIPMTYGKT